MRICRILHSIVAVVLSIGVASASAQTTGSSYPTKPLKLILPFAVGSTGDIAFRTLTNQMATILGQLTVIENVTGAAGLIGAERGRSAVPDGYTYLGMADSTLIYLPLLNKNAKFDPFTDFEPVTQVAAIDWVLVANPSFPAATVTDLIQLAKAQPGKIDYASGGRASPQHVVMELFKARAGVDLTHVPYKGVTPAMTDVVSGAVPVMFSGIAVAEPFLGKLKALAVTGRKRSSLLPEVPTMTEAGLPGFEYWSWVGLMVPARTPAPVIQALYSAATKALADPKVESRLVASGMTPIGNSPEAFRSSLVVEYKRLADLVKAANLSAE